MGSAAAKDGAQHRSVLRLTAQEAARADRIVTRPPGYFIRVEPEELDLERFERLAADDSAQALHEALELWRGPALADLAYESFAQEETARLEELRLAVQERRIDADLESGRSAELTGELEQLIAQHPLRERLRGQLMLALYRSGRQAEALAAYQAARSALVEELGIEPAPALQELERAMLRQDPSLDLAAEPPAPERSILVTARAEENLDALLALAEPLAHGRPARELILVRLTGTEGMGAATALLNGRREALTKRGVVARAVVFTSAEPGDDLVRLASEQDTDLVLVDCPLAEDALEDDLVAVLSGAPCDVALLVERENEVPVRTPIIRCWCRSAEPSTTGRPSRLLRGSRAHAAPRSGSREPKGIRAWASGMRAACSRVRPCWCSGPSGSPPSRVLVPRGAEGIVRAADDAGLVVSGVSALWHRDGLGETRLAIARRPGGSTLFVRRGLRPGGLAPEKSVTRFTWSLPAGSSRA